MIFKNRHSNRNYNDIHIFIDNSELSKVSHTKFLGVIIDESLTWKSHILIHVTYIVSKYSGILFWLKRTSLHYFILIVQYACSPSSSLL